MDVEGYCKKCGHNFDAHWHVTGTHIAKEITCPNCKVKGSVCTVAEDDEGDTRYWDNEENDDADTK